MKRLYLLLIPVLLGACQRLDSSPGERVLDAEGNRVEHGMIVLGEQLADPYSVENMSLAFAAVHPTKAGRVVLEATHRYVRFLPLDGAQYETLEQAGLQLVDHPLDYEIIREGDYYHDPEVPEEQITWQYTVVPKDFVFPAGIRHEVLDECYIPSDEAATKADGVDWAEVEREAFRLAGHAGLLDRAPGTRAGESGKPAGRITLLDDAPGRGPEGLRGVRVSCNSFVKMAHAYTDAEGNYHMDKSFASRPRYRLVFKNSTGFAIGFNKLLSPASAATLGRQDASGVDYEVTRESDRRLFMRCVVNNAGYDYYKFCKESDPAIKAPPSNLRIWLFQSLNSGCAVMLQQGVAVDEGKIGEWLGEFTFLLKLFLPDITLGLKGKESYAAIYAEAVHEFAHASHFMSAGRKYWDNFVRFIIKSFVSSGFVLYGVGTEENAGYCEVGEMWAYFLGTVLYRGRYGDSSPAFGLSYWFHPQILLQLEEHGLSCNKIFQALGTDVTDRTALQKKLISFYPEYKSDINQAFARYD